MKRYRVTQSYSSSVGSWHKGDEVDLDDETVAFLKRDSPGTLELIPGETVFVPEGHTLEKPPADRMVTSAKKRSG